MKRFFGLLGMMAVLVAAVSLSATAANAQRGGGGGGGGSRTGGRYTLVFNPASQYGKYTPQGKGTYSLSSYVSVLSVSMKLQSIDLPDNSQLTVTAYGTEWLTGRPLVASVGTMTIFARSATMSSGIAWETGAGLLPILTKIVVTAPDGTILLTAHP